MKDFLFKISDLACSYDPKQKPVFVIRDLEIPKGKITVILGKSGSGKSTLIETLGLMNDTIHHGEIQFSNHEDEFLIDKTLWKNPRRLAEIRKKHFSFIFQDDYLMPYYTSFENALISHLIQDKKTDYKILRSLMTKLKSVDLHNRLLRKRMPFQMAGGQKQRLSFTRAILKDFTAIFGDEPTGNLDEINSEALMDVLKEALNGGQHGDEKQRAAVIVSHNIILSVNKADKIVVLTSSNGHGGPYEVTPPGIFTRLGPATWQDGDGRIYPDNDLLIANIKLVL